MDRDRIERIVVAVDLTERTDGVIRTAVRIARSTGASILAVHVVHDLQSMFGIYLTDRPMPELQRELEVEARSKLRHVFKTHFDGEVAASEVVLTGVPWRELAACARRHRADLLIVGAHTDDKPEHRVLGSTVTRLLRHAPCPIVVVPPGPTE